MNNATRTTSWSTSAHGGSTEPTSTEQSALKRQLDECGGSRGRLFRVQSIAETMHRIVASHFVTSVFVVVVALVVITLIAKA
jgi:hypothetical protein